MNPNVRQNRNLTPEECAAVIALFEEGLSQVQIAERFHVGQSTISRAIRRFQDTGNNQRRPGQGRGRITDAHQDRFLRLQALRERFVTATLLR